MQSKELKYEKTSEFTQEVTVAGGGNFVLSILLGGKWSPATVGSRFKDELTGQTWEVVQITPSRVYLSLVLLVC